jgi:acetyl-CoA synthetase
MKELRQHVGEQIGPIARPQEVIAVDELPRRAAARSCAASLRGIAEGEDDLGDTSTLADPSVVDTLQEQAAAQR